MDYMTIKEIADLCGKTPRTITNWVSEHFPLKTANGVMTKLSQDEVRIVFNSSFGEKITSLLMQNTGKDNLKDFNGYEQIGSDYGYIYVVELSDRFNNFIATKVGITTVRSVEARISDYNTCNSKVTNSWTGYIKNHSSIEKIVCDTMKENIYFGREYFTTPFEKTVDFVKSLIYINEIKDEPWVKPWLQKQKGLYLNNNTKDGIFKQIEDADLMTELIDYARFRFDVENY